MINLWNNRDWKPMLLAEMSKPFDSDEYIFEIKFDGIRAIIFADKDSVSIQSRNKKDITHIFPELQNIKKVVRKNVIFDGEIVIFNGNRNDFSEIEKRIHTKNKKRIINLSNNYPATFIVFDILYEDKDLTNLNLSKRKELLSKYQNNEFFVKNKYIDKYGIKLFKSVKKLGLEGIIAKEKNSKYHINKRTDDFIKIKNIKKGEFLIGGYEKKKNNILSIAIGEYVNDQFIFVGKISITRNKSIYDKILALKKSKNYFSNFNENIYFVKPTIYCQVDYLERTKNNHLRHPTYRE